MANLYKAGAGSMRQRAAYILEFGCVSRNYKMYWKEVLIHTSNVILRLFVSVLFRIDRNARLECMVMIIYTSDLLVLVTTLMYPLCLPPTNAKHIAC